MSGIEGARVRVYREVVKPEALVAEGVTDERGFFRTTLPPARYIIITTWVDEEGVERKIQKEEELTATTQLVVNLPAPRIVPIAERVSLVPLARLKESIAEQVSLVPEARLAESIAEGVSIAMARKITVGESVGEGVSLVPAVSLSESIYVEVSELTIVVPGWEKLGEIDVTTDTTSVTFSGLDLDKSKCFFLLCSIKATAAGTHYCLCLNGDTTWTNYWHQNLHVLGTSVSAERQNFPRIGWSPAVNKLLLVPVFIMRVGGYTKYNAFTNREAISDVSMVLSFGAWTSTVNVTSVGVYSKQVANGIGAGSKFILFGVRE